MKSDLKKNSFYNQDSYEKITKEKKIKQILFVFIILLSIEFSLRITGEIYLSKLFVHRDDQGISEDSFVILTLGESTTAGFGVESYDSYPFQLQQKLNSYYEGKEIVVKVPPHMGQNTGQISNRINKYIEVFQPDLIVLMIGYNNEWSLAESNLGKFLTGFEKIKIQVPVLLENFRIYRMFRYLFIKYFENDKITSENFDNNQYLYGGPEYIRYPPNKWVYSFAFEHKKEFIELWRHDVEKIIRSGKQSEIPTILMTYHINPSYLSGDDFEKIKLEQNILIVRNDLVFNEFRDSGNISNYLLPIDNWHPNELGYEIISDNLAQKIKDEKLI